MITTSYAVAGMTCSHCVAAVTEELGALDGVSSVTVELLKSAPSTVTVTSSSALTPEQVTGALDEAGGYRLETS